MTNSTKKWIAWAIVTVAIVAAGYLGIQYPIPEAPSEPIGLISTEATTNYDALQTDSTLTVGTNATVGGTLDVTGASTFASTAGVTGAATFSSDVTVDDTLNLDETANTLTGAQTITPTTTYYQFAPTAVLTLTLATGSAAAGDLLILHNTVATNTTVVDTGATVGGGAITLSTNDLAIFIYGNSKWIEVASPDNS